MVRIFAACVAGLLASTVVAAPLSSSLKSPKVADIAAAPPQVAAPSLETITPPAVQESQAVVKESQSSSGNSADAGSAPKEKEEGASKKDKGDGDGKKDKGDGDEGIKFTVKKPSLMKWSGGSVSRYSASKLAIDAGKKVLGGSKIEQPVEDLL